VSTAADVLRVERRDAVVVLTFHRPQVLNAFDRELSDALKAAVAEAGDDPSIKALVLTGAGDHFMAGADISMLRRLAEAGDVAGARSYLLELFNPTLLERAPMPVIAAIRGYAFGMGCELALACDLRVGGESAQLGQPEIRLGIMPGGGGSVRLQRLVGRARALEMILTGAPIAAQEAASRGLLNSVVPDAEVLDAALQLAEAITRHGAVAIRHAKRAVWSSDGPEAERALDVELDLFSQLFATHDAAEGLTAFLEKRRPHFEDR
jgi:enoyl-CoA hydratase/carnithine racemase